MTREEVAGQANTRVYWTKHDPSGSEGKWVKRVAATARVAAKLHSDESLMWCPWADKVLVRVEATDEVIEFDCRLAKAGR